MRTVSRREFVSAGLKTVLFAGILNPFGKLFADSKTPRLPDWTELVEYARWCPTVHNLQPHKIKIISDTQADLYYDPRRLLPVGDPNAIFATVAMGIFIENLSIAAAPYSFSVEVEKVYQPISTRYGPYVIRQLKIIP